MLRSCGGGASAVPQANPGSSSASLPEVGRAAEAAAAAAAAAAALLFTTAVTTTPFLEKKANALTSERHRFYIISIYSGGTLDTRPRCCRAETVSSVGKGAIFDSLCRFDMERTLDGVRGV